MESRFGPPSDPINISEFISAGSQIFPFLTPPEQTKFSQNEQLEVSVADIRHRLIDLWDNPNLSSHLSLLHDYNLTSLLSSASSSRYARVLFPGQDAEKLQNDIDNVACSSGRLTAESPLFMRSSRNSDQNCLTKLKSTSTFTGTSSELQAVITFSILKRLPWDPGNVGRMSQHVLLSSQCLGDLFDVMPCTSKEIYNSGRAIEGRSDGCVVCIEGLAFGDGLSEDDYASKLTNHLTIASKDASQITKASTCLRDTVFMSLHMRICQPYWVLHQGNCEHFIVVEQIRICHESDTSFKFPLTTKITPPLLDLCRACCRVPAITSVTGDTRLGESPCLMCGECWKIMKSSPDTNAIVTSLPKNESGW